MLKCENMIVKLTRSLLRIEKNFGQNITEPLKKAMIDKSTPEFPILIGHASCHEQEIWKACRIWREDIEAICTIVKCEYYRLYIL